MDIQKLYDQAESSAISKQFLRLPFNAELGQLEWLRYQRNAVSKDDVNWRAVISGLFSWLEEGNNELVEQALKQQVIPEAYELDRLVLELLLGMNRDIQPNEMSPMVLVTNIANVQNDLAMERQEVALLQMDAIQKQYAEIRLLNSFVAEEGSHREGWENRPLPRNARDLLDNSVPTMPIFKDVLDQAAEYAVETGSDLIVYSNSDIIISPIVIELIRSVYKRGYECQGYSRTDIRYKDFRNMANWVGLHLSGTDLFVISVDWWKRNRGIFEDYIMGAYWWDCVFVGQMMVHSRFFYASHIRGLIFHQIHEALSNSISPQASYNLQLRDTKDIGYYDIHTRYCDRLKAFIKENRSLPCVASNEFLLNDKMTQFLRSSLSIS
ncbi:MAG: hypothetical protein MI748_10380 [Opitutales bacterium]|nr:hypothetical protein [Opitutales bacterium]